jgi:hypothetical protein
VQDLDKEKMWIPQSNFNVIATLSRNSILYRFQELNLLSDGERAHHSTAYMSTRIQDDNKKQFLKGYEYIRYKQL